MEPTYSCEFSDTELKLIKTILGEVPAKISLPLIKKISEILGEK